VRRSPPSLVIEGISQVIQVKLNDNGKDFARGPLIRFGSNSGPGVRARMSWSCGMWNVTPLTRGRGRSGWYPTASSGFDRPAAGASRQFLTLQVAWALLAILTGSVVQDARASDEGACRQHDPALTWVRQAEDGGRSYQDRRAAYESVIRSCPRDPGLFAALSALLLQHQDGAAALAWIRRGLAVAPHDPTLTMEQGAALLSTGQPEAALRALEEAPPSPRTYFYLGMTYRALRNPKDSADALRKAFQAGYEDPYVLYALIEQDRQLGDTEAGLADFKTFYRKFPDSPWLHLLYGDAYMARHDNSHAADEYGQAAKLDPQLPVAHFQLGFIALDQGNYSEAVDNFRQEIAVNPTFAEAYLYLGTSLRGMGKNEEAIPNLEESVRRDPNYALAYRSLAAAQIKANQLQAAVEILRTASRRFPWETAFPAQLAGLLRRLGRVQEAEQESQKAKLLSQENNPVRHGTATADMGHARTGVNPAGPASEKPKLAQATAPEKGEEGFLTTPSADNPGALAAALRPLYDCLQRSDTACATAALDKIKGSIKQSPDYLELEAKAFALKREKEAALAAIGKALQAEPKRYRYRMTEGQIYQSFNNQVSAVRCFLLADQLQPRTSETFYFLGMSFFLAGEYPRAAKHFQHAIELDPANHRALFMMGVVDSVTFKMTQAKPYFEKALKLQPENPFYHLHYGILLGRMGDQTNAIAEAQKAEALDPSYAITHYNLGHLYKDAGRYLEAKAELETAIRLRPSLTAAYYQLGWVYHRLGMEAESRTAYAQFQTASEEEKHRVADPVESNLLPAKGSNE
jgi:tetratricopeptide (TPR) repeat protein